MGICGSNTKNDQKNKQEKTQVQEGIYISHF